MRTREEAILEKRQAECIAEASGQVADSTAVRIALIERINRGDLTLEQAQAELAQIKHTAKSRGLTTRASVWREA